jgi:outer membrane autotransporter protein
MERLRLFAKAGVARTKADASFSSSGFVELSQSSTSKRQTSGVYGIGAQYAITPRVSVRVEYDVHDKVGSDEMGGKFKVQSATVGVVFPF